MKIKTTILSATALCLGLVVSTGFAGHHSKGGGIGIQLITASDPVILVCTHGVKVSATRGRPGFVPFPPNKAKLLCNLWVQKNHMPILVTDFGFRVQHADQKVKIFSAGLPQYDNSDLRYQRTFITWGRGAKIYFISYAVKPRNN